MIEALLIIMAGLVDRWRGTGGRIAGRDIPGLTPVAHVLYGWLIAALLGHAWDALTVPLVVAHYLGQLVGMEPYFAQWDRRPPQEVRLSPLYLGPLRKSMPMAVAWRGILWGAAAAPLAYWDPRVALIMIVYTIAGPLAVEAARRLPGRQWGWMEFLRGACASALLALLKWS